MIKFVDQFPNPSRHRFDKSEWHDAHGKASVIIHCESNAVSFPRHWGPLSLKTTLQGNEYYVTDPGVFKVSPSNFLILNEDTHYSSFIPAGSHAESLTINFGSIFLDGMHTFLEANDAKRLDNPFSDQFARSKFPEHIHPHHERVFPHIRKIGRLILHFNAHAHRIEEELSFLYEGLLRFRAGMNRRVSKINAKKPATREEIHRRIHVARDYMDACFTDDISLARLSGIACLSPHHLLRQFKSFFKITPRQYLIRKRLEEACALLIRTDLKVSDVCRRVGFEDRSSFSRLFTAYYKQSPSEFRS